MTTNERLSNMKWSVLISLLLMEDSYKSLKLDSPATYSLRVQGHLDSNWFDRLGGMAISADKPPVTMLVGRLADQAALSGVLNTLYELHLPRLTVENLGCE